MRKAFAASTDSSERAGLGPNRHVRTPGFWGAVCTGKRTVAEPTLSVAPCYPSDDKIDSMVATHRAPDFLP